jgi:hypothetical protein
MDRIEWRGSDGVAALMGAGGLMSPSGVLLANLDSSSSTSSALVLAKLLILDFLLVVILVIEGINFRTRAFIRFVLVRDGRMVAVAMSTGWTLSGSYPVSLVSRGRQGWRDHYGVGTYMLLACGLSMYCHV